MLRNKCVQLFKSRGEISGKKCVFVTLGKFCVSIFRNDSFKVICARRRVEQICRKHCVAADIVNFYIIAVIVEERVKRFCVVCVFVYVFVKQKFRAEFNVSCVHRHNLGNAVVSLEIKNSAVKNEICFAVFLELVIKIFQILLLKAVGADFGCGFGFGRLFGSLEVKALNHFEHFKLCKHTRYLKAVNFRRCIIRIVLFNGSVSADCAEFTAQKCHIFIVCKLIVNTFFDVKRFKVLVDFVNRAETADKILCGFLTDTCNAGNTVGTVAHKSLDINHLFCVNKVFFLDFFSVIANALRSAHFG